MNTGKLKIRASFLIELPPFDLDIATREEIIEAIRAEMEREIRDIGGPFQASEFKIEILEEQPEAELVIQDGEHELVARLTRLFRKCHGDKQASKSLATALAKVNRECGYEKASHAIAAGHLDPYIEFLKKRGG